MSDGQFQVYVSGSTSTSDDWFAAMDTPESDLPALNEDQKSVARKFDISESEYARGVLTQDLGETRQIHRGERLGKYISSVFGAGYGLASLIHKGVDDVWIGEIETPTRTVFISIPLGLADDVVDFGNPSTIEQLKGAVASELEVRTVSATS